MAVVSYLPLIETTIFNFYILNRCCHRKYSALKTYLIFFVFSAVFFIIIRLNLAIFKADGRMLFLGILYLIPLHYLYSENILVLFVTMCFCWVYTTGVFSLSMQISGLICPAATLSVLIFENLLFALSIVPFNKILLPKYIFVLNNIQAFDKKWYKYLAFNNCIGFVALAFLHFTFLSEDISFNKILTTIFLLVYIVASYLSLYKIVVDSIQYTRLEHTAMHDPLTGLANRAQLWKTLDALVGSSNVFSVLFMDLDRFKQINDQYGHMIGDMYLKHFADIASEIFRDHGNVYRFGGDEFVAIYHGIIPQTTIDRLTECREWDKEAPCPFNQVSTGVLFCRPPHQSTEQILHQVDELMYQNKMKKHTRTS